MIIVSIFQRISEVLKNLSKIMMLGFLEFVFGCLSVLVLYDVLYSGQVSLIRKSKNDLKLSLLHQFLFYFLSYVARQAKYYV